MKLDRNTNRGGRGKYALVNMRQMIPLLDRGEDHNLEANDVQHLKDQMAIHAFNLLVERGIITLGNETPGDQFFVMKYKDKFTHEGLLAYAEAASVEAGKSGSYELLDYANQIMQESYLAKNLGNRIPD